MKLEILSECPDFLRDFLTYNETIKGKSSRSVEGYYIDLRTFLRYMLLVRGKVPKDTEFKKINISAADTELIKPLRYPTCTVLWYTARRSLKTTPQRARENPQPCGSSLNICRFKPIKSNTIPPSC